MLWWWEGGERRETWDEGEADGEGYLKNTAKLYIDNSRMHTHTDNNATYT